MKTSQRTSAHATDAAFFARMALQTTIEHATICHFTLANVFAAQNHLDSAAAHYETALRLQPEFDLAIQTLRTLRCSQWVRRRKDHEITDLRRRLQQIQEMLSLQDARESAHLWAQLKSAEQRLEELVAQHHLATLPFDPFHPHPPFIPTPPLEAMTAVAAPPPAEVGWHFLCFIYVLFMFYLCFIYV
jgi:hypothetical protein